MPIHDVTRRIRPGMWVFPGDPQVAFVPFLSVKKGDGANVSRLCLGSHSGTHVDAPMHFIEGGAGVEALDLEALVGPVWVLNVAHVGAVRHDDLSGVPYGTRRLLIRTRGADPAPASGVQAWLSDSAAALIVERGVRLVGLDSASVDPPGGEPLSHRRLLAADVVILEGLDLYRVDEGMYFLVCLPLPLEGLDGSPVRAVLLDMEHVGG